MEVKRFLLLFFLIGLFSCSEDKDDAGLISEWQLIEAYSDPGDGSGEFQPVTRKKVIKFYENGEVWSDGALCDIFIDSKGPSRGTYSFEDSRIIVNGCSSSSQVSLYFYIEGDYLIIHYPCIEGCGEKYIKK